MIRQSDEHSFFSFRKWKLTLFAVTIFAAVLYFVDLPNNPPGFFLDESSISYNAYTISQNGCDESGVTWPLFFRAFGEYKNPVYIYLLAAIFRLTGPSILVARLFSAVIGVITALSLGLLAVSISKQRVVGLLVAVMALLTPWLFELSRVVFEVALYPLALALFLLFVRRAMDKTTWSLVDGLGLVLTLALLTYVYSIGRLFAPLMALGLLLFATRARLRPLMLTWVGYALTLLPALLFQIRYPGALTNRFQLITYVTPTSGNAEIFWNFAKHYLGNINPYRLFISEHSKVSEIIHIPGAPPVLIATALLAALGGYIVLRRKRRDAWWRFIIYGLAVSIVPTSLTNESFHMLRLAALPVFLIVLTVPALSWLVKDGGKVQHAALITLVVLTLLQGMVFQYRYHQSARTPQRLHLFDAGYPQRILEPALARSPGLIYLADAPGIPGYMQAYWYGALRGVGTANFIRLAPDEPAPDGALVISTEENCPNCQIIATSEFYTLYVRSGAALKREPLADTEFRARLALKNPPSVLSAGERYDLRVLVTNESNAVWPARERSGGFFQVSAGNHWLDQEGKTVINDDGRAALLEDLRPAQQMEMKLTLNAPKKPGSYLLEIDMLQEGVSWFGLKGSPTVRVPVKIE